MPPDSVYWMLVDSHQTPPEASQALSPAEFQKFSAFRFPKRRDEWLLGRWTAKALARSLPAYRQYPPGQIEVCNTPSGAPYLQLPDRRDPAECLSLSHSGSLALSALALGSGLHVGADLEKVEAHTETFVLDYFTPGERRLVDQASGESRAELATLIWSAKESMLKALGVGLRQDTRSVEVQGLIEPHTTLEPNVWQGIRVAEPGIGERSWAAWWQRRGDFILTLAAFADSPAGISSVQLVEMRANASLSH